MSFYEQQSKLQALQQASALNPTAYIPPTRRQHLEEQRFNLQSQLAKVEAALSALDKHPELEEFIDILQKAGV
jgi:hypothetical protein